MVHPVNWEGGNVSLETAALEAKEKCSTMLVRRKGEEGLPGPRRGAIFCSPLHMRLSVHSSIPVMRVEVSEVATPNPAEIKSPGV